MKCFNHSKLITISFIAVSLIISALFFISPAAKAESVDDIWSWTLTNPKVISSEKITAINNTTCSSAFQMREIDGEVGPKKMCVTSGGKVETGSYYIWNMIPLAVSFKYDTKCTE